MTQSAPQLCVQTVHALSYISRRTKSASVKATFRYVWVFYAQKCSKLPFRL